MVCQRLRPPWVGIGCAIRRLAQCAGSMSDCDEIIKMRLTRYTDYALRAVLFLGTRPGKLCSIAEMARAYNISQNHLMKVVNDLVNAGYLQSVRGRAGGIRLARLPCEINVGALVRHTEDNFDLADCNTCIIGPRCGLTCILDEAVNSFMSVLDQCTLQDVLDRHGDFTHLLKVS